MLFCRRDGDSRQRDAEPDSGGVHSFVSAQSGCVQRGGLSILFISQEKGARGKEQGEEQGEEQGDTRKGEEQGDTRKCWGVGAPHFEGCS